MRTLYPFSLPPLPYRTSALAPVISQRTVEDHYRCNHAGYVRKSNEGMKVRPSLHGIPLTFLVGSRELHDSDPELYRNLAQLWNHNFMWPSLTRRQTRLKGPLRKAVQAAFGSRSRLDDELMAASASVFGSGWAWLCGNARQDGHEPLAVGGLEVVAYREAEGNPLIDGKVPLLGIDLWEHAFYIDYACRRADYVRGSLALVDWDVVSSRASLGDPLLFSLFTPKSERAIV